MVTSFFFIQNTKILHIYSESSEFLVLWTIISQCVVSSSQCVDRLCAKILSSSHSCSSFPTLYQSIILACYCLSYLKISNQIPPPPPPWFELLSPIQTIPRASSQKLLLIVLSRLKCHLPCEDSPALHPWLNNSTCFAQVTFGTHRSYNTDFSLLQCCQKYASHVCKFKCASSLIKKVKRNWCILIIHFI